MSTRIATRAFRPDVNASATRIQTSVLTVLEKRTLIWLATRLPRAIHSDHLTVLALLAMIGAGASYWLSSQSPIGLWLATVCLAVNWFGDSLDGTVARVRDQQRPRYGYYVDHVVDAVGALALLGGLAASGYMSVGVAATLLIAYFLLCLEVYLAAHVIGRFHMSFFGVGPTELRLLLALGNGALLLYPNVTLHGTTYKLFDVGGAIGTVGLVVTFLYSAIRNTLTLYRDEPRPERTATRTVAPSPVTAPLGSSSIKVAGRR
jgi:archaetidylinositol phosphate synthase